MNLDLARELKKLWNKVVLRPVVIGASDTMPQGLEMELEE